MNISASSKRPPGFAQQLALVENYLGRPLPEPVRQLFEKKSPVSARLLPLATGREYEASDVAASDVERFLDAQARFESVLGQAIGNAELAAHDADCVWPPGLLVIEDMGCAVYRAVDLNDARLRVIDYEYLEPLSDQEAVAPEDSRAAYSEPVVPRSLQHRFRVVADSLQEWLSSQSP